MGVVVTQMVKSRKEILCDGRESHRQNARPGLRNSRHPNVRLLLGLVLIMLGVNLAPQCMLVTVGTITFAARTAPIYGHKVYLDQTTGETKCYRFPFPHYFWERSYKRKYRWSYV